MKRREFRSTEFSQLTSGPDLQITLMSCYVDLELYWHYMKTSEDNGVLKFHHSCEK